MLYIYLNVRNAGRDISSTIVADGHIRFFAAIRFAIIAHTIVCVRFKREKRKPAKNDVAFWGKIKFFYIFYLYIYFLFFAYYAT